MSDLVTLTIDGVEVAVPKGTVIVDAAKRINNDIPVFCYHPKMKPVSLSRTGVPTSTRHMRHMPTGFILDDSKIQEYRC